MTRLIETIVHQVNDFIRAVRLNDDSNKPRSPEDKLVMVNNSFPFRAKQTFPTNKSDLYLAFPASAYTVTPSDVEIISGKTTDKDYTVISRDDPKITNRSNLYTAVNEQLSSLGSLVLILVGEIDDSLPFEESVSNNVVSRAKLDPTISEHVRLNEGCLTVRDISDPSSIWRELQEMLPHQNEEDRENLRRAVAQAIAGLQQKSYARLLIPDQFRKGRKYFLDETAGALREQYEQYARELSALDGLQQEQPVPVDVLRIAYNFTDDALKLVRLLVSVSDLKPLVLWGTFVSQFRFAEALRNLPWSKQVTKPKLNNYRDQIAKARNRAFHRLLPFSKAFEVSVPDDSLQDVTLRIFSEYGGGTSHNTLTFKDKPLVDVLMEFSRTSEEVVDRRFWTRNLDVMRYVIQMVEDTSTFLKYCHSAISESES